MKKTRGFTLIECIVSLAILGIASLVMAQIYATVCNINRANHQNNSSIANQMKYVEEKTDSETVTMYPNKDGSKYDVSGATAEGLEPPIDDDDVYKVILKRDGIGGSSTGVCYCIPVDYHVLQARDMNDNAKYKDGSLNSDYNDIFKPVDTSVGEDNQEMYLNYKYFTAYTKED